MSVEPRHRELYRLPAEGKVAGVCAGIAEYFDWPAWKVRLLFVALLFLFVWPGIVAYLVGWFVLDPREVVPLHGLRGRIDRFVDDARRRWDGVEGHFRRPMPEHVRAAAGEPSAAASASRSTQTGAERMAGTEHKSGTVANLRDAERTLLDVEMRTRNLERFVTDQQFQLRRAFRELES